MITYQDHLQGVNWEVLKQDLIDDDFHNGRTTHQLELSFRNSQHVAVAIAGKRCIGNGRLLSDGVGNAYVIDVWTQSSFRHRGVARSIMQMLLDAVPGQHVYLQTDDAVGFYTRLGFRPQPEGLSRVVGDYLANPSRDE